MQGQLGILPRQCCTNDGGWPAGAAVQAEAPNRLMVLWSKAMVLSDKEKAA